MLARYLDWISKKKNIQVPHIGIVKDNNDPNQQGCIKVWIPGMLELDTELLPWTYPEYPAFLGGSISTVGFFAVPIVGSKIVVRFPYDDIYFGFYSGAWYTGDAKNSAFSADYPNVYGFTDDLGNYFIVDKTKQTVTLHHGSGSFIKFDPTTISIENGDSSILVTNEQITLENGDAGVTVTADEVSLQKGDIGITVTEDEITLENGDTSITLDSDGIVMQNNVETTDNLEVGPAASGVVTCLDHVVTFQKGIAVDIS